MDECYMDFTEIAYRFPSPQEGAEWIREGVKRKFGFTVNIGISENKLLAKMASDFENRIRRIPFSRMRSGRRCGRFRSVSCICRQIQCGNTGKSWRSIRSVTWQRAEEALIELHLKSHGRMLEFANGIGDDQAQSVPDEAKGMEIQRHWRKMQSPMKKQKSAEESQRSAQD